MITAAQDQALRTNAIKLRIEKQDLSPLCRMCGAKDETTHHLVCECSKRAQVEYKQRHDNVARIAQWNLAKLHRLDVVEKGYDHIPEGVMEGDGTKLLWDFNIQTGTKSRLVVVNRRDNQCFIIYIAVPNDSGIFEK